MFHFDLPSPLPTLQITMAQNSVLKKCHLIITALLTPCAMKMTSALLLVIAGLGMWLEMTMLRPFRVWISRIKVSHFSVHRTV